MFKVLSIVIALNFINYYSIAQKSDKKSDKEFKPIQNITVEEAFSLAKYVLSDRCKVLTFDLGKRQLVTTYYEYSGGFTNKRARIYIDVDDNNIMNIQLGNLQKYDKVIGWVDIGSSLLGVEEFERKSIAEKVRSAFADSLVTSQAKINFFQDLEINSIFYSGASQLAGDRWFDSNLKEQKVNWKATFIDLRKNSDPSNGFKYEERFIATTYNSIEDPELESIKFTIIKYTNSDKLISVKKGTNLQLIGYCRTLEYNDGHFKIILTENIDDVLKIQQLKNESVNKSNNLLENSEKLIKLKELLDKGIITKEEFENEKKKILNGN